MLLYNLARFNFSTYVFRGFDILKERRADITQFRIAGFRNFDDVHNYAQRIFHDKEMAEVLRKTRIELISEKNLQKLGSLYTYDDYRQFYDSCFVPLDITDGLPEGFAPEDDAADDAHYEEALPDASLYTQPAGERNETGGEEGEVRTAGDVPDAEGNGNLPRNAEEEFYEEGEGRAAESEILYIEEPSEKSGTPRKAADDEEIVADDGNAKNQTSTKANKEEIVIEDSPANAKAKTSTKTDNEEIVIEDTPANAKAKTSTKTDDDEIVIEDTP